MISMLGAQGTGKSTLLEELKKRGIIGIESPSREIHNAASKGRFSPSERQLFINAAFIYTHKEFFNISGVVYTRSIIDAIAWSKLTGADESQIEEMEGLLSESCCRMTLFYTPIEFKLSGDQYRPDNELLQQKVDEFYRNIMTQYKFKDVITLSGTTEERLQKALDYLSKL